MNLFEQHYIILLDAAAVALCAVFASLSRSLGEALKTPRYYVVFHVAIVFVSMAALADILSTSGILHLQGVFDLIPRFLRGIAGVLAVATALRYWKWLFPEFFHD